MKPRTLLALVTLPLAQCAHNVKPYTAEQESKRVEAREVEKTGAQLVFEDGEQAGHADRVSGGPDNYHRYSPLYTPSTEKAFADGYREGYHSAGAAAGPVRDEGYNQGYDIGMRDHASKKPSDPDAHIGEYDWKLRASFERGYLDGYSR